MRVPQNRIAEGFFQSCQFLGKRLMIRLPDVGQDIGPGLRIGGFSRLEQRFAIEKDVRIKPGSGGGVQRLIVRRAGLNQPRKRE
ncbi:Uncharacterised protein [Cedecea neteri]|uniref:Uncharacterized protein n=1 Tax=Cedecea neteri TaxID=158822 RepID=A0A2X3KYR4_9ENTR|nr:Uncharacterised protein [Cedecea neteri]